MIFVLLGKDLIKYKMCHINMKHSRSEANMAPSCNSYVYSSERNKNTYIARGPFTVAHLFSHNVPLEMCALEKLFLNAGAW